MSGLNPWFKTIINTLANRLRSTNARVKELESNSASINYGMSLNSVGEICTLTGEFEIAMSYLLHALELARSNDDLGLENLSLYSIASLQLELSALADAQETISKVIKNCEDKGLKKFYIKALLLGAVQIVAFSNFKLKASK